MGATSPTSRRLSVVGVLLVVVGSIAAMMSFLQPWRSCADEDTSAGCAMLSADAFGMAMAIGAVFTGVVLFGAGRLIRTGMPLVEIRSD